MNIREWRKKRGLTQEELAFKVGIHMNTLLRWEYGTREPKASELKKLAEILDCSVQELLDEPSNNKIRITLTYDWSKYEKGEIDMTGNAFDLNLGKIGTIGLHGAGDFTSLQDIDEFLARAREQLVAAFEAQVKRGAIQPQPAV